MGWFSRLLQAVVSLLLSCERWGHQGGKLSCANEPGQRWKVDLEGLRLWRPVLLLQDCEDLRYGGGELSALIGRHAAGAPRCLALRRCPGSGRRSGADLRAYRWIGGGGRRKGAER